MSQPDGLYQVSTPYLCAGFQVEGGQVVDCAPILRRRLAHWRTVARQVLRTPEGTWITEQPTTGGV